MKIAAKKRSFFVVIILYEIVCWILLILSLPRFLYQWIAKGKYKEALKYRLGWEFPEIEKGDRPLIWVHAVSVGETKAIIPLVKKMRKDWSDPIILISSVTETGHAEAKKSGCADHYVYLPFDFKWMIQPIVARISPDLVVISETDYWFQFLRQCKASGASTVLVNGKLSERSQNLYRYIPFFTKRIFGLIDLFCVQSSTYEERFLSVGVDQRKITVTGNLKLDDHFLELSPEKKIEWREKLGIDEKDPVLVIGSTHQPEEKELLISLKGIWKSCPNFKVLLVPRHPERFSDVEKIVSDLGLNYVTYSQIGLKTGDEQVVIIDAMGLLRHCYQIAHVAIVGGTFNERVGGHNILEPAAYGVPVLYGPYIHAQPEMHSLVQNNGAGFQLSYGEVGGKIESLLSDLKVAEEIGKCGKRLIAKVKGATDRTWKTMAALQLTNIYKRS